MDGVCVRAVDEQLPETFDELAIIMKNFIMVVVSIHYGSPRRLRLDLGLELPMLKNAEPQPQPSSSLESSLVLGGFWQAEMRISA